GAERGRPEGGTGGRGGACAGRRGEDGAGEGQARPAKGHQARLRILGGRLREPVEGQEQRLELGQEGRRIRAEEGGSARAQLEGPGCATPETPRVTPHAVRGRLPGTMTQPVDPLAIVSGLD